LTIILGDELIGVGNGLIGGEVVGFWQPLSSELSPQLLKPSQCQVLSMQYLLAHWNWLD